MSGPGPGIFGAGRVPGSTNKVSRAVKHMLRDSLDRVGGVEYLIHLAQTEPRVYGQLIAKLIPNEVVAKIEQVRTIKVVDLSGANPHAVEVEEPENAQILEKSLDPHAVEARHTPDCASIGAAPIGGSPGGKAAEEDRADRDSATQAPERTSAETTQNE